MPQTPKLAIPYPALPDPADVPTDTGELATRIDDLAGVANGIATLDVAGKVPSAQLPPAPSAIPPSLVDAKGDLIVASADDTPARLAVGTPGQVLVVDTAAPLGVKWATPAAIPATLIDAKGDLIVGVSNDSPGRLPAGADGLVLQTDSAQTTGLKWGAPPAANGIPPGIVDAKGDLIGASANDVPARLAVGADGQTLIADAASPLGLKWAAAPSGLPPATGHEGDWLKVVGGAAVWSPQYDVALAEYVAKGDLLIGKAPSDPDRLPVGADGLALVADAASTLGVKWAAVAAGGGGTDWEGAWSAAFPYVKGDVVTYNGVTYVAVNDSTGQVPPAGVVLNVPIVLALPASPVDGQECILVDSLTAPTYSWRLRYVAAKASNRWVFVGGAGASSEVIPLEQIVSTAYVNCATIGPSFTVPVAGVYDIEVEGQGQANTAGNSAAMSYDLGATAAVDADAATYDCQNTNGVRSSAHGTKRKTLAAGTAIVTKYRSLAGASSWIASRRLTVTPVSVGG